MPKIHAKVDVVTVGAGWTSSIMGWKLGRAGRKVVALEIGEARWANPDFSHNHDPLSHEIRKALMYDISQESWTWRPNRTLPSLPIRQYGSFHPGRGLGGASVHWTAQLWRFLPADFQHRSHNVERYGRQKIPADMTVQDWPITYGELEPFYDQVEYDIGASGAAGNLGGQLLPGGNLFEAPRSRPYPLPPHPYTPTAQMFSDACRSLGYHPFPQPAGILSQAYRDVSGRVRSGCIYCGYCTRFGCEVDAKTSAVTTHIPAALQTGNYEVRTYCKVRRINMDPDGRATGLTYVDLLTGQEHVQPAEVVMLTGYTLSNVRLLLLSQSSSHPRGVGNNRNMVGRNYTYQLSKTPTTAVFEGRHFNQFAANGVVQSLIYDFNADNFDHSDVPFIGGASISAGSGQRDPLTSALTMPPMGGSQGGGGQPGSGAQQGGGGGQESGPPKDGQIATAGDVGAVAGRGTEWGAGWKENLRRNWDSVVSVGVQGEIQAYTHNFLDLDPVYRDALGDPLLRLTFDFYDNEKQMYSFLAQKCDQIARRMNPTRQTTTPELGPYNIYQYQSTHCTGGAIMGRDPGDSVTNSYGQVWDAPNVFVTGAALYPQNPGANPTHTLLALAYRTGDALVSRYFRAPGELLT